MYVCIYIYVYNPIGSDWQCIGSPNMGPYCYDEIGFILQWDVWDEIAMTRCAQRVVCLNMLFDACLSMETLGLSIVGRYKLQLNITDKNHLAVVCSSMTSVTHL